MKPEDFIEKATAKVEAGWKGPKLASHKQHPDRPRYMSTYGNWAGNPAGHKVDFSRCCENVWPNERGPIPHQCHSKAKHDPDHTGKPTACGVHSDAAKKKRAIKAEAKWMAEQARWNRKFEGHNFTRDAKELIRRIADGHNDPRTAALELVAKYPGVFGDG